MRNAAIIGLLTLGLTVPAAERRFDFSELKEGQIPPGFRSAVTGEGGPGDWRMVMDEVPSAMQAMTPKAASVSKRPVLAQVSQNPAEERFPLLILEDEIYDDFTLTTRFKTVSGKAEQMAGLAFRIQNETNYYVLRASTLGNTFRFYKVVDGVRGNIIGPEIPIPGGVWHEMSVECKGNQVRCRLNGKEVMPPISDSTFVRGKIGFWTKSDSVSYFADTRIVYTARIPPAQALVKEVLDRYDRLIDLKLFVPGPSSGDTRVIAAKNPADIGRPGGKTESEAIALASTFYVKDKDTVSVIAPIRDRNGDAIAAARVVMDSFPGQTQQNAVIRAMPVVKRLQSRVRSLEDLVE